VKTRIVQRPRRLRADPVLREMVAETEFSVSKLMLPLFLTDGKDVQTSIAHLDGCFTFSIDRALKYLKEVRQLGIKSVLLFGVSTKKDAQGSEALKKDSLIVRGIGEIREHFPDLIVATDVALDPYTDHGHDGLFEKGEIPNDASVEVLTEMAILHAKAGAQIVAPSDMMDGRVGAIREALESSALSNTLILAYTAKYASCLYGPFRGALQAQVIGDKKTYQMDSRNRLEALKELRLDIQEGADIIMVKPAAWYLDIISDFKHEARGTPIAAYQVSGEVAMIQAAAKRGACDLNRAILESIHCIFRAGAEIVVTYFAPALAKLL